MSEVKFNEQRFLWQGRTACVEKLGHPCYVEDPTMPELTAHTKAGLDFAKSNSKPGGPLIL